MEGFMMSRQSGLKVLNESRTPKFGYNFLVHTVLQFLFLFYAIIFFTAFLFCFVAKSLFSRVLKASLF